MKAPLLSLNMIAINVLYFDRVEKKCIFTHMTCMAKPHYKNSCPGVIKLTNLVKPSLVINTIYSATSREEDFKRNISILIFFYHKQFFLKVGSHLLYNFLSLYPKPLCHKPNFAKFLSRRC